MNSLLLDKFHNNYDVPERERIRKVNTRSVKCSLDHPIVYYAIGDSNFIHCDYCGMKYVYVES